MDGTDLATEEPGRPINPRWFSHKINRAAIKYEVAIGVHTGWIVWVNGLYPAGKYSNVSIVSRQSLVHFLHENDLYIADGAYRDGNQWSCTPSGRHSYQD